MSSSNVLPSAPPEQIYPELPTQPRPDFRMQKVNEISAALNKEVGHYRTVAKKYKRAKKVVNWNAAGSSVLSALFSSASFGSAISVVGLPATIPLGGVGGAFALASSGLIIASKKLDSKIKKHLGRVVRKPVNANPGLKVNRGNSFSYKSVIHRLCFV